MASQGLCSCSWCQMFPDAKTAGLTWLLVPLCWMEGRAVESGRRPLLFPRIPELSDTLLLGLEEIRKTAVIKKDKLCFCD